MATRTGILPSRTDVPHARQREIPRMARLLPHDDARMAPAHNHIDGYDQKEGLSKFKPGEVVPGVNIGGWHDAGDFDLRIESQAGESYILHWPTKLSARIST